jgi:hypothetical protein
MTALGLRMKQGTWTWQTIKCDLPTHFTSPSIWLVGDFDDMIVGLRHWLEQYLNFTFCHTETFDSK